MLEAKKFPPVSQFKDVVLPLRYCYSMQSYEVKFNAICMVKISESCPLKRVHFNG